MPRFLMLLSLLCLQVTACSTNNITKEREFHLSSPLTYPSNYYLPVSPQGSNKYTQDAKLSSYVALVGTKLSAVSRHRLPYEFIIVNNSLPNVWNKPGGKIYISRGLLLELSNEAELAYILAHQMVHSGRRSKVDRLETEHKLSEAVMAAQATLVMAGNPDALVKTKFNNLIYSEEEELIADQLAMEYLVNAGYNPKVVVTLQGKFMQYAIKNHENWNLGILKVHVPSATRLEAMLATLKLLPKINYVGRSNFTYNIAHLIKTKPGYDNLDKAINEFIRQPKSPKVHYYAKLALKYIPNESLIYSLLGDYYLSNGKLNLSIDNYTKAIELDGSYYYHYKRRSDAYSRLDKKEDSLTDKLISEQLLLKI